MPDERLKQLQHFYDSKKQIPATVTFVDIAGLVKGAASGEGLGNQFLSNIYGVDLILHVLRCFEDPNIIHHGNTIDPIEDYQIIISELMLKDLESVKKRLDRLPKQLRGATQALEKKSLEDEQVLLTSVLNALEDGNHEQVRKLVTVSKVQTIPLLTAKNFLIIANIAETELETYHENPHYQALVKEFGKERVIPISAKIEYELSQLEQEDAQEMMGLIGLEEPGLNTIIRKTYDNLGLITFFTCGPKEVHAWPIKQGTTIRKASGEIHSDLERGFICAELFNCKDLLAIGSEAGLKESGKIRKEGQDYIVNDGDIVVIRFNV